MQNDEDLMQSLLYEEESVELDMKSEQYRFIHADDKEKSELLKDVLAFANAWRRSDAFILVGVEDVKGERNRVIGISELLDDADIQQFINSKTQRPIAFSYRNVPFEGKKVGLIHIPIQRRPFYLIKDYGRLKMNTVYIRRGTSTAIADLEEISLMGSATPKVSASPKLEIFFGDPKERKRCMEIPTIKSLALIAPEKKEIPDYSPSPRHPLDLAIGTFHNTNYNYYRELSKYTTISKLVYPLFFAISNTSEVTAHDVRIEIKLPAFNEVTVIDDSDYPSIPHSEHNPLWNINIRRLNEVPRLLGITVRRMGTEWLVQAQIKKVQPKATHWIEDPIYIGAGKSQEVELDVFVFADNLPEPHKQTLSIRIEAEKRKVDLDDIRKLERERIMSDPRYSHLIKKKVSIEK